LLPKTFASFASLLKQIMLQPGQSHTNNLQSFFQEQKMTPLTEHVRTINPTLKEKFTLQCSCKEMKIPSWPIMAQ